MGVLVMLPTLTVDVALLLRMLAVYPRSTTGTARWLVLLAVPVCTKVARVAVIIGWCIGQRHASDGPETARSQYALESTSMMLSAVDNL
jgi:hypothetical protein